MLTMVLPHEDVPPGEGKYINLYITLINQVDFDKCPAMSNAESPSGAKSVISELKLSHMNYNESKQFGMAVVEVVKGIKGNLEEIK